MNELADRAIEHELAVIESELEEKLRRTLELLGPYRQEGREADVAAFARAEVTEDDPLLAVASGSRADSPGVGARSLTVWVQPPPPPPVGFCNRLSRFEGMTLAGHVID